MKVKAMLIVLIFFSSPSWSIELIIGGKTYYIEKYHIKDNGMKIEIPYTIHLDPEQVNENACANKSKLPAQKVGGAIIEGGRKPASSGFGDLMKSVQGGFKNLSDSISKPHKSKRNYR